MKTLSLITILFFLTKSVVAQSSLSPEQQALISKWKDADGGKISYASDNPRAATICYQLARYSDMQYPVIFSQNLKVGHGHRDGVIIIDYDSLNMDRNILAFILAHEWGHQKLGHEPNIQHSTESNWKHIPSSRQSEDEADRYAGKFLAIFGYDPTPVYKYLSVLSKTDQHTLSTGKARVELVKQGYNAVNLDKTPLQQANEIDPTHNGTVTVKCTHLMHPAGDQIPCTHKTHPLGHKVPCQHACHTPAGMTYCHPDGDTEPCTHVAHYSGDRIPCTHLMHPSGDVERSGAR